MLFCYIFRSYIHEKTLESSKLMIIDKKFINLKLPRKLFIIY